MKISVGVKCSCNRYYFLPTTKKQYENSVSDDNSNITKDHPIEDYHTTIAELKKQTKDFSALLKKYEEELSEKNEILSKKQSIIQSLQ